MILDFAIFGRNIVHELASIYIFNVDNNKYITNGEFNYDFLL